jgi:cell shape-determining protein MreC
MASPKVAAQAVRLASSRLGKLVSEREQLRKKIAELESREEKAKKIARAHELALKLVIDEDTMKSISEKSAQLLDQDLDVVEKAIALDLTKKEGSIGTELSDKQPAAAGDALIDYLTTWSNSKR